MALLINLPKVKSQWDVANLRRLLNSVQAGIKTLEAIGTPVASYAFALESALLAALPPKLLFEFAEMNRLTELAVGNSSSDALIGAAPSPDGVARKILKLIEYVGRYAAHREQMETLHSTSKSEPSTSKSEEATRKRKGDGKPERKSTVAAVTSRKR